MLKALSPALCNSPTVTPPYCPTCAKLSENQGGDGSSDHVHSSSAPFRGLRAYTLGCIPCTLVAHADLTPCLNPGVCPQATTEVAVRKGGVRRSRQAPWINAIPDSTPLPDGCPPGDLACALEFLHVRPRKILSLRTFRH